MLWTWSCGNFPDLALLSIPVLSCHQPFSEGHVSIAVAKSLHHTLSFKAVYASLLAVEATFTLERGRKATAPGILNAVVHITHNTATTTRSWTLAIIKVCRVTNSV
jgi:hypothetical protein